MNTHPNHTTAYASVQPVVLMHKPYPRSRFREPEDPDDLQQSYSGMATMTGGDAVTSIQPLPPSSCIVVAPRSPGASTQSTIQTVVSDECGLGLDSLAGM